MGDSSTTADFDTHAPKIGLLPLRLWRRFRRNYQLLVSVNWQTSV
jgi:hypothetical protein